MTDMDNNTTPLPFTDLNLSASLMRGIKAAGFTHCTPIQALSLPHALKGKDVAAQAQTGTGKTAAFLITIFHQLEKAKPKGKGPYALVIAPTRELALQICDEGKLLGKDTGREILPVFGGIDYVKQQKALRKGVDIVVATPGRLMDFMKQKVFVPKQIRILVIDEADRLFDMGFLRDLRFILRRLPRYNKRQSMLFSATLSYAVMELAYEHMNNAKEIFADPENITVDEIDQALYHVGNDVKLNLLLGLLKREEWKRVLVFANTRAGVDMLAHKLSGNGFSAIGITGTVHQSKRLKIMQRFKAGQIKILVATDVASRGIHVEDIDIVINYDIPQDPEDYVHRIGRTGRAGKTGRSITLACETYVYYLEAIEDLLQQPITVKWAEDDWFEKDRSGPMRPRRRKKAGYRSGSKRQRKKRSSGPKGKPPR
jgi:ATP-dependent RNA helicase RhlB